MLLLALTFALGVASPAMALTAKQKRVVKIIKIQAKKKNLSNVQIAALLKIAKRESTFRPTATNGSCKGLFQLKTSFGRKQVGESRLEHPQGDSLHQAPLRISHGGPEALLPLRLVLSRAARHHATHENQRRRRISRRRRWFWVS